jgi:hypothetical protein
MDEAFIQFEGSIIFSKSPKVKLFLKKYMQILPTI